MKLKKLASAGRFGARYGRRIKQRLLTSEIPQRAKHKCQYCMKKNVRRVSLGIWECRACKVKFTGKAYSPGEQKAVI
ncbi:MAG: 50S ribosomal protein L37ae [uncultured DHVE6 group euryarchaeote]|jgi:large subunit ribosomal protein L37Ae|nr:MAG: 50S ribosomal protein L37ae [uncultured DHVE6 group euryarchaeote]